MRNFLLVTYIVGVIAFIILDVVSAIIVWAKKDKLKNVYEPETVEYKIANGDTKTFILEIISNLAQSIFWPIMVVVMIVSYSIKRESRK